MTSNPNQRQPHHAAQAAMTVLLVVAAGCATGGRSVKAVDAGNAGTAGRAGSVQPFSTTVPTPSQTGGGHALVGPPATLAPRPPTGTGAFGLVTAGPTCPVQRVDQPCPPAAVASAIDVRNRTGVTVASTHSDSGGRYSIQLPPGSYTLVAVTGTMLPRCRSADVTVTGGAPTRADIGCDTGIR